MRAKHLLKVSRLESLTDGIFAIAMTIMVLNLNVPDPTMGDVPLNFTRVYFNLMIYMGSFIILGTHWVAMNFLWGLLDHLNRVYLWVNLLYLMVICVVPFSADLLGAHPNHVSSIIFYGVNLLCASVGQFLVLHSASHHNLFKVDVYKTGIYRAALLRLSVAPVFYITSILIAHVHIMAAFVLLVAPTIIYLIPGRIDKYDDILT